MIQDHLWLRKRGETPLKKHGFSACFHASSIISSGLSIACGGHLEGLGRCEALDELLVGRILEDRTVAAVLRAS